MQPDEFLDIALEIYGERWPSEIAYRLRIDKGTVKKYAKGKMAIPNEVAGIMRYWLNGEINYGH